MRLKSENWFLCLNETIENLKKLGFEKVKQNGFNTQERYTVKNRRESVKSSGLTEINMIRQNDGCRLSLYTSDDNQLAFSLFVSVLRSGVSIPLIKIDTGISKDWFHQLQVICNGNYSTAIDRAIVLRDNLINYLQLINCENPQRVLDDCLNFFRGLSSSTISNYQLIDQTSKRSNLVLSQIASGLFAGVGIIKQSGRRFSTAPITQIRRKLQTTDFLLTTLLK